MIVRPKPNWFRMLFVWKGSVLPLILPRLLLVLALSIGVVVWHGQLAGLKIQLNPAPFTLLGVALAIFVGFRNGTSYDRFWEARKIWGGLLNDTRSLTRQVRSLTSLRADDPLVKAFVHEEIALIHALRHQLRRSDPKLDLTRLLPPEAATQVYASKYRAAALADRLGQWIRQRREEGTLDSISAVAIDQNLNNVSTAIGGCERIASTPLPFSYAIIVHRVVHIYCFLLPLGLVDTIGWMTPIITVIVAYAFIALEELAGQLEDPFGTSANDLALDAINRMIESTLREQIGEAPLPDLAVPDDFLVT
jgi:putative membrane protein